MATIPIDIRAAREQDADRLSAVQARAWRNTYRGVIPAISLERFIAERDGRWWQRTLRRNSGTLVVDFDGEIAGYVTCGPVRRRVVPADGEIYELYLDPDYQGVGLVKRLFKAASKHLSVRHLTGTVVWVLDVNEPAVSFYRGMGGQPLAKAGETFGGTTFEKTAFIWR